MKFFENFKFNNLFSKKKIDENLLNKFEELLIESDVGTEMASDLKDKFKEEKLECVLIVTHLDTKDKCSLVSPEASPPKTIAIFSPL